MRAAVGAALTCVVIGVFAFAAPAAAAPTSEVVQGEYLRLVSVADWERAADMRQGEDVRWDVAISADAPEPGAIAISLSADGGAPLTVDAALCDVEWNGEECPGGAATLRTEWEVPRDGGAVRLAETDSRETAHLRLRVGLAQGRADGSTRLSVHAVGAGEGIAVGPDGELPRTGSSPGPGALVAGAALLAVGTGLLLARRLRPRGRSGS